MALLDDIANLTRIAVDRTSVDSGNLVLANVVCPVPSSNSVGNSAFSLSVVWWVTRTNPNVDAFGVPTNATPPAILGTEYIAPAGTTGLSAVFGLMPPFVNANPAIVPPTPYWIVARVVISWAADLTTGGALPPAGTVTQKSVDKAIGPINANGLALDDLTDRIIALFKVEIPGAPVDPGNPITARLRPKSAEDAPWDVESASEIAPQFDLAAKVQLEPLFRPLGRIINGVFGVGNQIVGTAAKIVSSLVRGIASVIGKIPGVGTPKVGRSLDRTLDRLIRRLRIRDVGIFKGLELPIDANLVNRNFTKNLVPHNATPPLPGPRSLLPSVPTLENQLEVMDTLPVDVSLIPIAGNLTIPLLLNNVVWELWDNPNPPAGNQLVANVNFLELDHTAGRNFKRTLAIEPPSLADSVVYLRVQINCTINDDVANPGNAARNAGPRIAGHVVTLPLIPIRLLRLDPLAFVTQQLQLAASVEQVELGETVDFDLQSSIPLQSTAPGNFQASFPLGELPLRTIPINVVWQVLDNPNGNVLVEGTDYALSGTTSDSRSIIFAPVIQVIRRENPVAVMRYVQVVLAAGALPPQTIGPIGIPVVPVLVPLFVAFLQYAFFGERTDDDTVQVLLPSFYVSHAPDWVESWDTFRERLDDLSKRVGQLLAAAAETSAATPAAAGSVAAFSGSIVERLTLLRGALDYVVNRPKTGKLEFMVGRDWEHLGKYNAVRNSDVSAEPMGIPGTIIVINDALTEFELTGIFDSSRQRTAKTLEVQGTQNDPVCVLWPVYLSDGYYWIKWIPNRLVSRWTNGVSVTCILAYDYWRTLAFDQVACTFDQAPGVNDYMPSPAAVWRAVAS